MQGSTEISGEVEEVVSAVQPNFAVIGPRFREKVRDMVAYIKSSEPQELWNKIERGEAEVAGIKITEEMVKVQRSKVYHGKEVTVLNVGDAVVLIL